MSLVISPLLFSYDLSHVFLLLNLKGGFSTHCGFVKPGEGFRSAAARIVGEANGPETQPEDWLCFHTMRVRECPDRKILYHTSHVKSEGFVGMGLKEGDGFWIPTQTAISYSAQEVFGQYEFRHDALLSYVIPMAYLSLTTEFRNLES